MRITLNFFWSSWYLGRFLLCNSSSCFRWVTTRLWKFCLFFLVQFVDLAVTPKSRGSSAKWIAQSSLVFRFRIVNSWLFEPYPHLCSNIIHRLDLWLGQWYLVRQYTHSVTAFPMGMHYLGVISRRQIMKKHYFFFLSHSPSLHPILIFAWAANFSNSWRGFE